MNDRIESNKYETIDGEEDVLLLGQATFTVRRFKELASKQFNHIFGIYVEDKSRQDSISSRMRELWINEETKIYGENINWNSRKEGIDCQILKIGSKGWQKGKLKIEVNSHFGHGTEVCIKFCLDEAPEQKSPLDDIRQSEEYKKLSNNN
ncbi:MAG: KGK family protein [Oscillatoriales cyanobacterium]|uniref:KGK domain-containing protein n=1 Tax=Microcoleus anatoxicus PTRS2 TaxID=2705321 RepID=A0ABU8YWX5_9CYAN|nr:MAG: KGK family protein [Oscillatoriales cyanobacterium]TAF01568.1 MAG: KGK family protein [Oscillatoriales cyanobacterium]TAF35525.1 MAG: KGK family protein [Oscillatoriales cyanobacterium]TAF70663.1 MAG: KGK family protein [Oscillatoriales cyanobacterium]